jgi:hypothetical protein
MTFGHLDRYHKGDEVCDNMNRVEKQEKSNTNVVLYSRRSAESLSRNESV